MRLPFTREAFFDLFAAYNGALWPAVVSLWVASAVAAGWLLVSRRLPGRWISALLAVHWAWAAVAYHAAFFTRINPAAWLFGAMFLVQAALFFWAGVIREHPSFHSSPAGWTPMGWVLIAYALVYPGVNAIEHGSAIRVPLFGVPCPTTIFTAGLLLLMEPRSRALAAVPILWSAIGGSAAFLLGVSADYALPVAGAALVVFEWRKSHAPSSRTERHVPPPDVHETTGGTSWLVSQQSRKNRKA
jgi:hypothetical protein